MICKNTGLHKQDRDLVFVSSYFASTSSTFSTPFSSAETSPPFSVRVCRIWRRTSFAALSRT